MFKYHTTNLFWIFMLTLLFMGADMLVVYFHPNQKLVCQYVNKE